MGSPFAAVRRFVSDECYRRLSDDEVWARFRDHADGDALRQLLERVGGQLTARCRVVTGDPALAEDALQDALVQLVTHRRRIGGYPQAVGWLYRAADRRARMLVRTRRRALRRDGRAARPEAVADRPPTEAEAVVAAVAELPERERRAVELVYFAGMSHEQAATALGLGRGAVGKYVSRGLERLRGRLGPGDAVVVLAAGGMTGDRAAALSAAALAAGTAARVWPKLLVAGGLLAGGVGWVATREPPPPAARAVAPTAAESVPDRNLRAFHAEVLPRVLAALRAAANGGEVGLAAVAAHDTRVDATFTAALRVPGGTGWPVRVRYVADADTRRTLFLIDPRGGHQFRRFYRQPDGRPTVFLRDPLLGLRLDLPVAPLAGTVAAFDRLPRDARTAAAGAEFRAAVGAAVAPHLGVWYERGDPARGWRLGWHGDELRFVPPPDLGWAQVDGVPWMEVFPDGPAPGQLLFEDRPARFAPGGRLELSEAATWWSREPIRR